MNISTANKNLHFFSATCHSGCPMVPWFKGR